MVATPTTSVSSSSSSSTSTTKIIYDDAHIAFEYKNGRKLVHDQSVAYILPSDSTEVERLRLNHNLWKIILNGLYKSPIHESLEKGITVLDVGCGPGFWTRDMATLYPKSNFIGIDMADVFVITDLPSNVEFRITNAANGLPFENESIDFVFQRFLVMGFPSDKYKHSIAEIKRVLKPTGTVEILELVNDYTGASPPWLKLALWVDQAMTARGLDSFIGDKISTFLKDAKFRAIKDINYHVPIGDWGGEPGELFLAIQRLALPAVGVMVSELTPVTEDEYKETCKEALAATSEFQTCTRFRLIYAKK